MLRVIIALPTSNEAVHIFEQTITGGFSSVSTRLAFDTDILLPNLISEEKQLEEFQKDYNYKIYHNIRLNNEKKYSKKKRVITKILKLDENNQYGFGMTKPLPTGCINQNVDTSWMTFNLLLQNVSLDD